MKDERFFESAPVIKRYPHEKKKPKSVFVTDLGSALRTAVAHLIEHPTNYGKCSGFDSRQWYAHKWPHASYVGPLCICDSA